jgi:hypothetical protein
MYFHSNRSFAPEFPTYDGYSEISHFVGHPQYKSDGNHEILEKKHVHADGVVYIGKEANNIDEQELNVKQAQAFVDEEEIKRKFLEISQNEV